uniref:NADH-ubiquinone oxidoreductase chain 1 n=1 Tax=Stygobromus allegheniensis TaxID=1677011 RepID=A0A6C0X4Z0_9CRUS|nr:NADH dehydrogenase subunit 1 [Stygobromus allegheniensis]QIC54430.1 NADH dehydrogenase subunit 1 [Stygobromus allegheniensis]
MEFFVQSVGYLVLVLMVLVSVAFVTLMEQKILGCVQIRIGPNKSGYWGLFQPFADAVKLFNKETGILRDSSVSLFLVAPMMSLGLALSLWVVEPISAGGFDFSLGVLFFICVSGLGVYPLLVSGWASNCKYSIMGSLRAVAQMVSYEVSLAMILLCMVWVVGSFSFSEISLSQSWVWGLAIFLPLSLIWLASSLAETNRTPYDFAEGESELVSGFNTEYSSGGFTLIFMAEYTSIIFMSLVFSLLFLGGSLSEVLFMLKVTVVVFVWVWIRGSVPRFRYDKLMYLAWKSFLPVSLMLFVLYLGVLL